MPIDVARHLLSVQCPVPLHTNARAFEDGKMCWRKGLDTFDDGIRREAKAQQKRFGNANLAGTVKATTKAIQDRTQA